MHSEVQQFCCKIRQFFPARFKNARVLDCGSLDINGNNRYLFEGGSYVGVDLVKGKNVDVVGRVHELPASFEPGFDVVISTEMLEHDVFYKASLAAMFDLTVPGGLLLFTAAGTGRKEHGTKDCTPEDSPGTQHYYQNITVAMILEGLNPELFSWFEISYQGTDIRFAGIKR